MASETVGTCRDSFGDEITVGVVGAYVAAAFAEGVSVMHLAAEQRDQFIKLWAAAEIEAERNGSPVIRACCDHCDNSEPDGHGYTLGGPHDGPCERCAAERARREHDEGTG